MRENNNIESEAELQPTEANGAIFSFFLKSNALLSIFWSKFLLKNTILIYWKVCRCAQAQGEYALICSPSSY